VTARHLQQQLGYSAAQTGIRFLALTGAMFLSSTIAGRLSQAVPTRLMIGSVFTARLAGASGPAVRTASAASLNDILLIGSGTALVAAVTSFALIRGRDFVASSRPAASAPTPLGHRRTPGRHPGQRGVGGERQPSRLSASGQEISATCVRRTAGGSGDA
jgi:hypothetical protein